MLKGSMAKWLFLKTAITATAASPVFSAAFVPRAASLARRRIAVHPLRAAGGQRNNSSNSSSSSSDGDNNNIGGNFRTSSLFESMRTGYYRKTNSDEISMGKLLKTAASVRSTSFSFSLDNGNLNDRDRLFFSSSYDASGGSKDNDENDRMTRRGFSNWIVPGKIMVGQYPGRVPETNTPTEEEVKAHLRTVLFQPTNNDNTTNNKNEVCFVSLQSELPPQDDCDSWNKYNGEIHLANPESRREWPNPFSHYAPLVESVLSEESNTEQDVSVRYIHHPIQDLSVPSNSKNLKLLLWKILNFLDKSESSMVYIHCWGGRGRAGLTACCLLTLLEFAGATETETEPTANRTAMDLETIFDVVQTGYESRLGSEHMPPALSRSPQTESQRAFVKRFYEQVRAEATTAGGGTPNDP